jgi:hypothetical protein
MPTAALRAQLDALLPAFLRADDSTVAISPLN